MIHKELFSCSRGQGPGFLGGWRGRGGSAPPTPAPAPRSLNLCKRPPFFELAPPPKSTQPTGSRSVDDDEEGNRQSNLVVVLSLFP